MNVIEELCTPFLEALSSNQGFDIVVPKCDDSDFQTFLENEMEEGSERNAGRGCTKKLLCPADCKKYAQIMALAAFIVELKSGTIQNWKNCL